MFGAIKWCTSFFCNPPSDVPKWAVDANNIESDYPSVSDVLEDGQVMELTEPLLSATYSNSRSKQHSILRVIQTLAFNLNVTKLLFYLF